MEVSFDLSWRITIGGADYPVGDLLFKLLDGVRNGGHLKYAAREASVSYRHAWGFIRTWEGRLGQRLVTFQRGRGASLTRAGQTLLDAYEGAAEQTDRKLTDVAAWTTARLARSFAGPTALCTIVSSHSEAVHRLRDALVEGQIDVALDIVGSEGALRRYQRGDADAAGFHLPLGALGRVLGTLMLGMLDPARDRIYFLEKRTLGLMSRPDKVCRDLGALVKRRQIFVNRQSGSGTRLVFDGLIGVAGIAPGDVVGYGNEEHTHTAVAALVACAGADAGFGTEAAAVSMQLHFEPVVEEHVYLAIRRDISSAAASLIDGFCETVDISTTALDSPGLSLAALRNLHGVAI